MVAKNFFVFVIAVVFFVIVLIIKGWLISKGLTMIIGTEIPLIPILLIILGLEIGSGGNS